jgi:hypothetical protein
LGVGFQRVLDDLLGHGELPAAEFLLGERAAGGLLEHVVEASSW